MKHGFIKVAIATPELKLADCGFNSKVIEGVIKDAAAQKVKILAFPELCICGCTCGDLFRQEVLLDRAMQALEYVVKATRKYDMLIAVGVPLKNNGALYNCAAVVQKGELLGVVPQKLRYDADELNRSRYFSEAPENNSFIELFGEKVSFGKELIFKSADCEDLIVAVEVGSDFYMPYTKEAATRANILLNISAASYQVGKGEYLRTQLIAKSAEFSCAYMHADASTGESTTDLVFSGHSVIAENGYILAEKKPFAEQVLTVSEIDAGRIAYDKRIRNIICRDMDKWWTIEFSQKTEETQLTRKISPSPFIPDEMSAERCEEILTVQAMALKRRWQHTRAKKIVLGISGGLDSALALLAAVRSADAMGIARDNILSVTMPCFGTTARTKGNAERLCEQLGVEFKHVDIKAAVNQHFSDIGLSDDCHDAAYENAQARERTQVLMDMANMVGGFVLGTGDLSELALGWATYNGDHMSMYAINGAIPKTLVRYLVQYEAQRIGGVAGDILTDIVNTPISPELLPAQNGEIVQKTEDLVGPYELHDFYIYYALRWGFSPSKIYRLAKYAFDGEYDDATLQKWIKNFYRRFFTQQFKRSCLPDGPKIGTVGLSPRGDWIMPSDAFNDMWTGECEALNI